MTWRLMANQTAATEQRSGESYDYNDWHMALLFDTLFLKVWREPETMDDQVRGPGTGGCHRLWTPQLQHSG